MKLRIPSHRMTEHVGFLGSIGLGIIACASGKQGLNCVEGTPSMTC